MPLTRVLVLAVILAMALSAQLSPGRRGPGDAPAPRLPELTVFLELTGAQLEAIQQIQRDYRSAVRDNMQAIAETRRQAHESLASDSPDATLIGQLLVQAQRMEEAVRSREDEFIAQTKTVLSDAQRVKLSTLEAMIPYQSEIREAQGLGLLPGEDGEFHFYGVGAMGPPFGGPGFGRP